METQFAESDLYLESFFDGLTPDPQETVDRWADEYVYLPSFVSEPGKYRTSRTPFWREVYECLSPAHPCHHVVLMKPTQIGGTIVGINWMGYTIHRAPAACLIVEPHLDLARKVSKQKLQAMIDLSPQLNGRVREARERDSGNTTLSKEFLGGNITLIGSNSASSLRSVSVKNLMLDELDAYEPSADKEGDPAKLAENRTISFPRRKIFKLSTPLDQETSRIEPAYLEGSRGRYHVPCPHCMHTQSLRFANLIFTFDGIHQPERAAYQCEACGSLIAEHHKQFMMEYGAWVHEDPDNPIRSFHINSFYMPYGWPRTWCEIAKDFLAAKKKADHGDVRDLKTFTNTVLAETWREKFDKVESKPLMGRREHYAAPCPNGVLLITAAADVQGDRIEAEKVGWGLGDESWGLSYRIFIGPPSLRTVWDELEEWLREPLTHESGLVLSVQNVVIDTGGHHTQEAYDFVKRYRGGAICAGKGSSEMGAPLVPQRPSKQKKSRLYLWMIGTVTAKDTLFPRLALINPGHGYMHFPDYPEYDEDYFDQLTSEVKKRKYSRFNSRDGHFYEKETAGQRNESLDIRVYNMAALAIWKKKRSLERLATKMSHLIEVAKTSTPIAGTAQIADKLEQVLISPPPVSADRLRTQRQPRRSHGFVQGW